jgi:hypothetical protein
MEILALALGVWLLAAVAVALLIGRFLRVADRRERATTITAAGMPRSTRATARKSEAQETA